MENLNGVFLCVCEHRDETEVVLFLILVGLKSCMFMAAFWYLREWEKAVGKPDGQAET